MAKRIDLWGKSGLTIVVLPAGLQAERLYTVAKEWTSLRLLGPSIWVRPEDLIESEGPPSAKARVLASTRAGEAREREIELFELLSLQPLSLIRLLVVRPAVPGEKFDQVQDEFVERLAPYLDIAIPRVSPAKESDGEGIALVKINLITGPTEHVVDDSTPLLGSLFNVHFVPSAEDRSGPRTGDAFVRYEPDSPRFAGFTMLHVATLGAIWEGIPNGGYELSKNAAWEGDSVYVSRVFVSSILTDGLIRRACAKVLESVADSRGGIEDLGVGLNIDGTFPIQDADVDLWLDFMVQQTFEFDDGVLRYQPALESPTPPKVKWGFGAQLGDFFTFAFGKLIRIPYFAWRWFLGKLASLFNRLFQRGDKGSAEVAAPEESADPLDLMLLKKFDEVFEVKRLADQALVSPVGKSNLRSTPVLWEKLRKLVFGLMDGSNLSQFGISRSENGWPVFYRVDSVFPDPSGTYKPQLPSADSLKVFGWGDATEAQRYVTELIRRQRDTKRDMQSELDSVIESNAELAELKQKLWEHFQIEIVHKEDVDESLEGQQTVDDESLEVKS
jgi:hypothetical protein